jgi:carbamoyl-phosphate synthase large subunit
VELGFSILATSGTAEVLKKNEVAVSPVNKAGEGKPDILDLIGEGIIAFLINTPGGKETKIDETKIRSLAVMHNIPLITTVAGARATINGLEAAKKKGFEVKALQDYHNA